MSAWCDPVPLGATGLKVGRLGIGASYGVGTAAIEAAVERGANFLYWGSLRRAAMARAIRNLAGRRRDRLVVAVQSYARLGVAVRWSLEWALRQLRLDHADVLILGWWNREPPRRVLDAAVRLRERGLIRALALSGHHRPLFPRLAASGGFGAFMVRYNAAHRGAEHEVFPHLPAGHHPLVIAYTATRWGQLVDPARTPPGERVPEGNDCYRFALSHPRVGLALAGPANDAQMAEALRALDRGPMDPDELAWMRRVGDHVYRRASWVQGDREAPAGAHEV